MTPGRAALIALMSGYATHALAMPSLIESQKLTYFLQAAGEPLHLQFAKHLYGPTPTTSDTFSESSKGIM